MRPQKLRRRLMLVGFVAITAGAVTGTAIARADSRVDEYTVTNAAAICLFLDRNPGVTGVETALAEIIIEDGFTPYQGGTIVATAVMGACPEHMPVLEMFVAKWTEARLISGGVGGRIS